MDEQIRNQMLQDVIAQLQETNRKNNYIGNNLNYIYAHFHKTKKGKEIGCLPIDQALDALINDIYNFYDFDLRDAKFVKVQSH